MNKKLLCNSLSKKKNVLCKCVYTVKLPVEHSVFVCIHKFPNTQVFTCLHLYQATQATVDFCFFFLSMYYSFYKGDYLKC